MTKPEDMLSESADPSPWLESLDAAEGPARPLSAAEVLAFVERVHGRLAPLPTPRVRRLPPMRKIGVAAAFIAVSAAAAVYTLRSSEPDLRSPEATPARVAPAKPPPAVPPAAPKIEVPAAAPQPQAPASADAPSEGRGAETSSPPDTGSKPGVDGDGPAHSGNPHTAPAAVHPAAAADQLAEANRLRGQHRYRPALGLYLQVIERYPSSIQASAARVAAAAIRLEQFGDVQGAERLYRDAKTSSGQLTPEAQFGLAEVYRARGDYPAEGRALDEFVHRYSDSPLVSAAKRRLRSLEQ